MGATAGLGRVRHLVRTVRGSALAGALGPIAAEIAQDRTSLLGIMKDLGILVRRYKVCAGWTAEKMARLKSNGRFARRSPLSTFVELEMLRLGGRKGGWMAHPPSACRYREAPGSATARRSPRTGSATAGCRGGVARPTGRFGL